MTPRLNILLLSAEPPYPPTHGGARVISYHRLKQLSPRHDFTLMTFLETSEDHEFIAPVREFCKSVQVFERPQHKRAPTLRERFQAFLPHAVQGGICGSADAPTGHHQI